MMKMTYVLCFNLPTEHEGHLEGLWVDEISFSAHWRKFVLQKVTDWREQIFWALGLAVLNAIFFLVPDGTKDASGLLSTITSICRGSGLVAEVLSLGSIVTAMGLVQKHQPHTESHAMDASDYFDRARHETLGFQPLAIIYSVPAAMLQWSFMLTAIVLISMPWRLGGSMIGIVVLAAMLAVFFAIWKIHAFFGEPSERTNTHSLFASWFPWLRVGAGYTEIPSEERISSIV